MVEVNNKHTIEDVLNMLFNEEDLNNFYETLFNYENKYLCINSNSKETMEILHRIINCMYSGDECYYKADAFDLKENKKNIKAYTDENVKIVNLIYNIKKSYTIKRHYTDFKPDERLCHEKFIKSIEYGLIKQIVENGKLLILNNFNEELKIVKNKTDIKKVEVNIKQEISLTEGVIIYQLGLDLMELIKNRNIKSKSKSANKKKV